MRKFWKKPEIKASILLLAGMLWVLYSGFAFSSPYVSRQLWEAFHSAILLNISLFLTCMAFWSCPVVLLCVWCCSTRVSRVLLYLWWGVALLAQWGWVYLII